MLDSVRSLVSAVMTPSADRSDRRPIAGHDSSGREKIRVYRISSRYPVIEVRTRMDSYGVAVKDGCRNDYDEDKNDRSGTFDDDKDSRSGDLSDDKDSRQSDFDDDDPSSKTETAACCSSASDTDFYYEDRTSCHSVHKTVVEIRSEDADGAREFVREEEFQDSLITVENHNYRHWNNIEISTKHRHVLSDTCRVKVQNLRYTIYC